MPAEDGPAPVSGVGMRRARWVVPVRLLAGLLLGPAAVVQMTSVPAGAAPTAAGSAEVAGAAGAAGAAAASGPNGVSASDGSGSLILTGQTPWVIPSAAGTPFDLTLRLGSGLPNSSSLGLSVAVFPCLSSVSAFDQSISSTSGPAGTPIARTGSPLPWPSLSVVGSGVGLQFNVVTGESSGSTISSGNPTINLPSANSPCAGTSGVYPVHLQLIDTRSGSVVTGITSDLVYAQPAHQKLRFAMVVPITTTIGPAPAPGVIGRRIAPSDILAQPLSVTMDRINSVVGAMTTFPSVPITVPVGPQTLEALSVSGHTSAVKALSTLSANTALHQFPPEPFAEVDAADLVDAGLGGELSSQLDTGGRILTAAGITTVTEPSSPGNGATWITNDGLDDSTLVQLEKAGYSHIVLPASALPASSSRISTTEPVSINPVHGSPVIAMASNADLSSRFGADLGNPVLAASQLLGELAQIYFESPNSSSPRAVVAVPPNGWEADPILISTLLNAMSDSPIVQGTTVAELFATFPPPSSTAAACHSTCRLASTTAGSSVPFAAIRSQRAKVDGFTSVVNAAPDARLGQLNDLILAAEAQDLRSNQQTAILRGVGSVISAQLAQVFVAEDTVTLTARNGRVPVTIVSSASYPITGTLTVTSDRLLFAGGTSQHSQLITLTRSNNPIYINVLSRGSGESKVDVSLRSPSNGLVIATGLIKVRSTATSLVGVALSLGAILVLMVWWTRTARRRRSKRRMAEDLVASGDTAESS
jgi:hypothetical protein